MRTAYRTPVAVVAGLLLAAVTWGQGLRREAHVVETVPTGQIDWTLGVVTSRGRVEAETGRRSRRAAFDAALQKARRRLLETLLQVPLDGAHTVEHVMQQARAGQSRLQALVADADVVQTQYGPRRVVEVTLQAALAGDLTALVWPERAGAGTSAADVQGGVYTGIVIDARGLAIRPALFPDIVDEQGEPLYTPGRVQAEAALARGYVAYARTLDQPQARSRVGTRPLIVRAQRVVGPRRVNLVLRRSEAAKLQRSAATRALLERCQVLIVG